MKKSIASGIAALLLLTLLTGCAENSSIGKKAIASPADNTPNNEASMPTLNNGNNNTQENESLILYDSTIGLAEIPGSHTYEIYARLKEGLPEYRFVATGITNGTDDWAYGYVLGLEIYDNNNKRILTADFSEVQDGSATGYNVYNQMMDTMGLHVVDVNFDGYKDVIVLNTFAGAHGNTWYDCWLWDDATSSFMASKSFSEICNPSLDPENKRIYSTGGSGAAYWGGNIYKFINGEFVLTNELDTSWEGLVERELANGEMIVVREVSFGEGDNVIKAEQEYYKNSELWQLDHPRWYWSGGHESDQWLGG